jgi:hypothetical protein
MEEVIGSIPIGTWNLSSYPAFEVRTCMVKEMLFRREAASDLPL